jgi:hypothetical protein
MSHQCPFPVRSTDCRNSYRTGAAPGFSLCLALVAALSGYAGFSHADSSVHELGKSPVAASAPAPSNT